MRIEGRQGSATATSVEIVRADTAQDVCVSHLLAVVRLMLEFDVD